jgi:hypothetical protein
MRSKHALESVVARRRVQPESGLRFSGEANAAAMERETAMNRRFKAALHATIHESTAATKAIADGAGFGSYAFLCACANPSLTDQLPARKLPLVLAQCDNLALVEFLAGLQGATVVRLPTAGAAEDVRRHSATMREFAEFMEAGAAAVEDVTVAPDEFARVEREALEAVNAILELVAHYRARVTRPLLEGK